MKTHLNLIPISIRRRQVFSRTLSWWTHICGGAILIVAGLVWLEWDQTSEQLALLDSARRQYAPLKSMEDENLQLQEETESLQQRERLALELSQNRSTLTMLGQLSFAAQRCAGKVSISDLTMNTSDRDLNTDGDANQPESKLLLQGVGVNDVAIAQFVAELRDSRLFHDVQLTSTGSSMIGEKESKLYTVECIY